MSEQMARRFHEAYERLAPEFGYETRVGTRTFDPESANGKLMAAVCAEVMGEALAQVAALREALARALDRCRTCRGTGATFTLRKPCPECSGDRAALADMRAAAVD